MKRGKDNYSAEIDEFERKARKSKKSKRPQVQDRFEDQHLVRPHHFLNEEDFEDDFAEEEPAE